MKRLLRRMIMLLTLKEKETLLALARAALETSVRGKKMQASETEIDEAGGLTGSGGAFVSLHIGEALRGCIGMITSDEPVYKTVIEMAEAAALEDMRFEPVTPSELSSIDIEISLLTPLKQVSSIDEIETGRHGLYIRKGRRSGLLLPQVAVENGFEREEFLAHTCLKAGLAPGCWKDGMATIYTFEAEIIKEG